MAVYELTPLEDVCLGVMSLVRMAVVAGVIAVEKTLPWRRVATYGTAALLLAIGLLLFFDPGAIPALTVPAAGQMHMMGSWTRLTSGSTVGLLQRGRAVRAGGVLQ